MGMVALSGVGLPLATLGKFPREVPKLVDSQISCNLWAETNTWALPQMADAQMPLQTLYVADRPGEGVPARS